MEDIPEKMDLFLDPEENNPYKIIEPERRYLVLVPLGPGKATKSPLHSGERNTL